MSRQAANNALHQSAFEAYLLRILDRRIPLLEDPIREILERGIAHLGLHHNRHALADLEAFVEKTEDAGMRDLIEKQIEKLRILATGN